MTEKEGKTRNIITDYFRSHPRDIWLSVAVLVLCASLHLLPGYVSTRFRLDISRILTLRSSDEIHTSSALHRQTSNTVRTGPARSTDQKGMTEPGAEAITDTKLNSTSDLKAIDPNNVTYESLISIGIDSRVASNWVKYSEAGGQFRSDEDLLRVYGMTEDMLKDLKGMIIWKDLPHRKKKEKEDWQKREKTDFQLDINLAMANDWQRIYGIGPVLSERIVKFREALGGFHSIDQVSETYGVSDSLFSTFRDHLFIHVNPDPLDINHLSEKELSLHPYISYKQAKILSLYRKEHGPYKNQRDLLATRIVDSIWLTKMQPYLVFGN